MRNNYYTPEKSINESFAFVCDCKKAMNKGLKISGKTHFKIIKPFMDEQCPYCCYYSRKVRIRKEKDVFILQGKNFD